MVHDINDLLGEQAGIDGVANGTGAGHAVIDFEMAMVVPGKRGDPITGLDAEAPVERMGELLGTRTDRSIAGAVMRII